MNLYLNELLYFKIDTIQKEKNYRNVLIRYMIFTRDMVLSLHLYYRFITRALPVLVIGLLYSSEAYSAPSGFYFSNSAEWLELGRELKLAMDINGQTVKDDTVST